MPVREVQFEVAESPVAQPRQRFGVGHRGDGTPVAVPMKDRKDKRARIEGFKNAVRAAALLCRGPLWPRREEGGWGFRLYCLFKMPPPAGLPKTRTGYTACPTKPDLDNMVKAVKDALTGVLWKDDGAVFDEQPVKLYPPPGERPGALVIVQAVPLSRRLGVGEAGVDALIAQWRSQSQLFEGVAA